MIDTLRFKIELEEKVMKKLLSKSTELRQLNKEKNLIDFSFNKIRKPMGSFQRSVLLDLDPESNCCYLEFSLPKQIIGHNVFMINSNNLLMYLEQIHKRILAEIGEFPHPFWWEYYRIDFCYAWQMLDDISTQSTVAILQSLEYPRKKTYRYGTSVMFMGTTYSVKFYMKGPEFLSHDFKELKNSGHATLAYDMLQKSRGVLRFEVTLRSKALRQVFNIPQKSPILLNHLLTQAKIEEILNKFLQPILKLKAETTTTKKDAAERLLRTYSPTKAARLYTFMTLFYSTHEVDKMMIQDFDRTTTWRNLRDLRQAGVGIPCDVRGTVALVIPSSYSVPIV